jgi:hypothetical protein
MDYLSKNDSYVGIFLAASLTALYMEVNTTRVVIMLYVMLLIRCHVQSDCCDEYNAYSNLCIVIGMLFGFAIKWYYKTPTMRFKIWFDFDTPLN